MIDYVIIVVLIILIVIAVYALNITMAKQFFISAKESNSKIILPFFNKNPKILFISLYIIPIWIIRLLLIIIIALSCIWIPIVLIGYVVNSIYKFINNKNSSIVEWTNENNRAGENVVNKF